MLSDEKRRLGIRHLRQFNRALKRFCFRHLVQGCLWQKVVKCKYSVDEGNHISQEIEGFCGMGLRKGIMVGRIFYLLDSRVVTGTMRRIRFWLNLWRGNFSLSVSLFQIYVSLYLSKGIGDKMGTTFPCDLQYCLLEAVSSPLSCYMGQRLLLIDRTGHYGNLVEEDFC